MLDFRIIVVAFATRNALVVVDVIYMYTTGITQSKTKSSPVYSWDAS